jgi:hypothetical protein
MAVLTLYPLAISVAAVAVVVLRTRILPRWIGIFAAMTAVAFVINGGFVFASFVPALLLFLLWTLVTAVVLLRRSGSAATQLAYAT